MICVGCARESMVARWPWLGRSRRCRRGRRRRWPEAGRTSLRQTEVVFQRAGTAEVVPSLAVSLEAGRVSGEHVDVLTRVLRQLEPAARSKLIEAAPELVVVAEQSTADEFARVVRAEARRFERDGDGLERMERQRRAVRLTTCSIARPGWGAGRRHGIRRRCCGWRIVSMLRSRRCSTTPRPTGARVMRWRSRAFCGLTRCSRRSMVKVPSWGVRRSLSLSITRPPMPNRWSIGVFRSSYPSVCWPICISQRSCAPWRCTTGWSSRRRAR